MVAYNEGENKFLADRIQEDFTTYKQLLPSEVAILDSTIDFYLAFEGRGTRELMVDQAIEDYINVAPAVTVIVIDDDSVSTIQERVDNLPYRRERVDVNDFYQPPAQRVEVDHSPAQVVFADDNDDDVSEVQMINQPVSTIIGLPDESDEEDWDALIEHGI